MSVNITEHVLRWKSVPAMPRLRRRWTLEQVEETYYQFLKRCLDLVAGVVLLVLTAPLVFLCGLLVKLTSSGPMFYTQVRLGRNGRPFRIYKLRTMRHECEKDSGPRWASANDPRVTPLGRFLRATHLDELPQLFNILAGQMSLVGPRPERPEFVRQLEHAIPLYRERLRVRPGVTGLAQVHLPPDSDLTSVRRKMAYDYFYIRQMNVWLDLRLIVVTALQVVGVPFRVSRRLLFIPDAPRIEPVYEALVSLETYEAVALRA